MFSLGSFFFYANLKNRAEVAKRLSLLLQLPKLQHVELWLERGDWTEDEAKWLRKQLGNLNCIIHAPFISLSLVSTHKKIAEASFEALKRAIQLSEILNCRVFTFHLGGRPKFVSENEALEICASYLEKLLKFAGGRLKLAIENLPYKGGAYFGYPGKLSEAEKILALFPKLYMTVDIGHCVRNNDNYQIFFQKYLKRVADVHLHNVKQNKDHLGFNQEGEVDLSSFINFIKKINYQNYISFEISDKDPVDSWRMMQGYL